MITVLGIKPIKSILAVPFNSSIIEMVVPATDSTPIYINDLVSTVNNSDQDGDEFGIEYCTRSTPGQKTRGIVIGFQAVHEYENINYRKANQYRIIRICQDPFLLCQARVNAAIVQTDVNRYINIDSSGGNNITGFSDVMLDYSTINDALGGQFKITKILNIVNDGVNAYSTVECVMQKSELLIGSILSNDLWDRVGTNLVPANAGDSVDLGLGDIRATNGDFTGDVKLSGKLTVGGLIDPTALILSPQLSAPSTDDGTIYYNLTDELFYVRQNGIWKGITSSSRETKKGWIDQTLGSDVYGVIGDMSNPFETYNGFASGITGTNLNRYLGHYSPGRHTEATLVLKPYIFCSADDSLATEVVVSSGSITASNIFSTTNGNSGVKNIHLVGTTGLDLDLRALTGYSGNQEAIFNFENCSINGSISFKGRTSGATTDSLDTLYLFDSFCFGAFIVDGGTLDARRTNFNNSGSTLNATVSEVNALIIDCYVNNFTISARISGITNTTYMYSCVTIGTLTIDGLYSTLYIDEISLNGFSSVSYTNGATSAQIILLSSSSTISNASTLTGRTLTDALDNIKASNVLNDSSVSGTTAKDALDNLNSQIGISASSAVSFYLDDTAIIPTGTQNVNQVNTLSKTPVTTAEVIDSTVVNNNTVLAEVYLYNTAIGGTQIDAGTWQFALWRSVDNISGTTQLLINIMLVKVNTETVAITGTGTSRTATASGGTIFIAGDAAADITASSYIQTPTGCFQITGFTSATETTITVPSTYVNESSVAFKVHRKLFQVTTGDINDTTLLAQNIMTVQAAFPISTGDMLSTIYFGRTTRLVNTTVSFTHNGNSRYTHFESPLVTRHNDLAGLQGGTPGEDYHITADQSAAVTGANSPSASNVFATIGDIPTVTSLRHATDSIFIEALAGTTAVGYISAASDFPTIASVSVGKCYYIFVGCTDNDPAKTNTGQTFVAHTVVYWNGTNWTIYTGLSWQDPIPVNDLGWAQKVMDSHSYNTLVITDGQSYVAGNLLLGTPSTTRDVKVIGPAATLTLSAANVFYYNCSLYLNRLIIDGSSGQFLADATGNCANIICNDIQITNGGATTGFYNNADASCRFYIRSNQIYSGSTTQQICSVNSTNKIIFLCPGRITGKLVTTSAAATIAVITADRSYITETKFAGSTINYSANISDSNVWLGTNDFTAATTSVATQAPLDNTTKAASTAYADAAVAAGINVYLGSLPTCDNSSI